MTQIKLIGLLFFALALAVFDQPSENNTKEEDDQQSASPMRVSQTNYLQPGSFEYGLRWSLDKRAKNWHPERPFGNWVLKVQEISAHSGMVAIEGKCFEVEKSFMLMISPDTSPEAAATSAFSDILRLIRDLTKDYDFVNAEGREVRDP